MNSRKRAQLALLVLLPLIAAASNKRPLTSLVVYAPKKPSHLERSLEDYFAGHVNELVKRLAADTNWNDPSGNAEPDQEIPGTDIAGDNGCSLDVPLKIRPARYTHFLVHRKKGHPQSEPSDLDTGLGYVVARIENQNKCQTLPINLPPGYTYLVIRKNPSDGTYESYLINDQKPDLKTKLKITRCDNPDHAQAKDKADVYLVGDVCSDRLIAEVYSDPKARARYINKVAQQLRLHLELAKRPRVAGATLPFDPRMDAIALWFACDAGCCYADQ